jgi:acetyl-CoA carboxylase biotin carboxyl carrier protein
MSADGVVDGLRTQAQRLATELPGPLRRITVTDGEASLEIEWQPGEAVTVPTAAPQPPDEPGRSHIYEVSPMVGTFYRAAEPGADPFVAVGDVVKPGTVIGIVEAMKLMNEVVAEHVGVVEEILVADAAPVEYDQPLIALGPLPTRHGGDSGVS